jgi:hypothetical protein
MRYVTGRRQLLLVLATAALAFAPSALAAGPVVANGGGIGTLDGVTPFSHFGFGVTFSGGSVNGDFNCLMAGNAAFVGFEPLMKVSGTVTAGTVNPVLGTASFDGAGALNLGPTGRMAATFHVDVREGGPGVGTLHLTVLSPPFPVPPERVLHGYISVH